MMIILYVALLFTAGQCTEDQNFLTKTVDVGENVTVTCTRRSNVTGSISWIKLVPGNLPEALGAVKTFDNWFVRTTRHFTAKQGPGTFVLHINQIKPSDTAFYYCEEIAELQRTVFNVTFINVKGPQPKIRTVIQDHPSAAVHPEDSVTLQCSVLSESDHQMCPDDYSVHWFTAGSDQTHPRVINVHNGGDKCERSPEAHAQQKCVYNYSWSNFISSDAGTYYCAVVSCGQILFGNGAKLEIKEACLLFNSIWATILLFLLCAALAGSVIVNVFLFHKIKKPKCDINATGVDTEETAVQQSQQTPEDALIYSMPHFTKMKTGKKVKGSKNTTEQQSIYADVRVLGN